jgi:hypothetical protein
VPVRAAGQQPDREANQQDKHGQYGDLKSGAAGDPVYPPLSALPLAPHCA